MQTLYHFRQNTDLITSSGALTDEALPQLVALDYQLVINLLPDSNKNALADEQQRIESTGISYFYIPVDFTNPTEQQYQEFSKILNTHQSLKTHIHCAANFRASAFYAVYAFEAGQWSQQKAEAFITNIWQPQQYPIWWSFLKKHLLFS